MSKLLKRTIIFVLLPVLIVFIVRFLVFDYYTVEQMSMYKTIKKGDIVIINKFSKLKTGNIIVCEENETGKIKFSRLVAKNGNILKIKGQYLYLDNKLTKYQGVTYSYCLRYISKNEEDSLQQKYLMSKINNSGFFQVELTDKEYGKIMNDTLSNLKEKLVPAEKCRYNIFSEPDNLLELKVPKDSVFILNDKRSDFSDSRTLGLIPENTIIGKVIYVF